MKKVNVYLADGFEEIEAITIIDVLRRVGVEVSTVSITADLKVVGAHDISVFTDELFVRADNMGADMIVLPGGLPGTTNLEKHKGLKEVIEVYAKNRKFIGAICAAPSILGKMGILEGRCATCYPGFEQYLNGADVTSKDIVVCDNNIVTSKGPGTAIHFALKIVELLVGKKVKEELSSGMIV